MSDLELRRDAGLTAHGFTADQIDLIKRTIAKDATDDELALFVTQCNRTGLDPFNKQIYFVKRGSKVTIQTGIDGYRLVADRTGSLAGQDGPWWCGADGQWREVWLDGDPPTAAKVIVKKVLPGGAIGTFPAVAHWSEYAQSYNGKLGDMWQKMPALMLAKCAEALGLRKAFPAELSGVYTAEEMGQAAADPPARHVDRSTGEIIDAKSTRATTTKGRAQNGESPFHRSIAAAAERAGLDLDALSAVVAYACDKPVLAQVDGPEEANKVLAAVKAVAAGTLRVAAGPSGPFVEEASTPAPGMPADGEPF